mgnify:CR=1 FL=1
MKKSITVIIPYRGIGDVLFHYQFLHSIYKHHKKKIFLIAQKSTKANLLFKNNKIFEKIVLLDLTRPSKLGYFLKILKIIKKLSIYDFKIIYYTGNHNWQKIILQILNFFKNFELIYFPVKKYHIIDHLKDFQKKINIKNNVNIKLKISSKFKNSFNDKLKKYKKPWAFMSIDTAEDQIQIPEKYLNIIFLNLMKKYRTIFINTSKKNKKKLKSINTKRAVPTFNYNILEINYLIQKSKIFVGNDSGPANLSSLINHKSVIFLSNNVKGDIKRIKHSGKRIYIRIENIKKTIKKILNFF